MAISTGLTIEDFEKLPAALARNHELVDGELVDVSGNTPSHNDLKLELAYQLRMFVRRHSMGRVLQEQEYQFGDDAHGPDISFVLPEKAERIAERRVQLFAPDLAIEIVSLSDTYHGIQAKARKYLRYGTQEIWIISFNERDAIKLTEQGKVLLDENQLLETELIPGFSVRLRDLLDQMK